MFELSYLILVSLVSGAPQRPQECCMEKMVGGVEYRFIHEAQTESYNCLANCVYEKIDTPGSMFCFAEGELEVECEDKTTPPSTDMPEITPPPTDMPETPQPPIDMPETTPPPSDMSETPQPPINMPEIPPPPTDITETPQPPTDMQKTTQPPTNMPETTQPPIGMPENTQPPTDMPETTQPQSGIQLTSVPQPNQPSSPNGGETTAPVDNTAAYCALDPEHTMCKFTGPSAECAGKTFFSGMSDGGKTEMLDRHNNLRRRVAKGLETGQPGASDMRKLVWNDELATIAQRLTDQCVFAHDASRNKLDGTRAGQNLYIAGNSQQQTENQINAGMFTPAQNWYDEVTDPGFDSADINPFVFSSGIGHYTALVWAETEEIGCGLTYYKDGIWFRSLVSCNYAIGGNMIGASMYNTAGSPCDNCPTGYTCDDGLCVAP